MIDATPEVTLRRAGPDDAETLAALGAATFSETFGHLYSLEDLDTYLSTSHSVEAWTRTLADAKKAVFAALPDGTAPVGFISVGPCKLPVENRAPLSGEIYQLYVLGQYRNLRLGSKLMDAGLQWLESQGHAPLYIGVWSENAGAQRFYGRYGFAKVGEYGFPVGRTVDREFILER